MEQHGARHSRSGTLSETLPAEQNDPEVLSGIPSTSQTPRVRSDSTIQDGHHSKGEFL